MPATHCRNGSCRYVRAKSLLTTNSCQDPLINYLVLESQLLLRIESRTLIFWYVLMDWKIFLALHLGTNFFSVFSVSLLNGHDEIYLLTFWKNLLWNHQMNIKLKTNTLQLIEWFLKLIRCTACICIFENQRSVSKQSFCYFELTWTQIASDYDWFAIKVCK